MNIPLAIFLILSLTTIGSIFLRGYGVGSALASTLGCLVVAGMVLILPLGEITTILGMPLKFEPAWTVLGRSFILTSANRAFVGFLALSTAILMANWWTVSGRYFYPIGVLMLAALTGSLLIEPFLFAAIFLEFAAIGAVVLIATGRAVSSSGSLRILSLYTLSMVAILTTGWLLENAAVTSETPQLVRRVVILIGVGFAILMVVPPFHSWLPAASNRTQSIALILVLVLLQSSGLFFLLRFLDAYAWLRIDPLLVRGIQVMGSVMVITGGVLALTAQPTTKSFLYAALADFGISLLAVGAMFHEGFFLALAAMGVRVLTLGLWAFARHFEADAARAGKNSGRLPTLAILGSWLALSGFPLTPGYAIRWNITRILLEREPGTALIVVVGSLLLLFSSLSKLRELQPKDPDQSVEDGRLGRQRTLIIVGLGLFLLMGLLPQGLAVWVETALEGLPNLAP